MPIGFIDGHFIPLEELQLPIQDRGFLFGDGVFTTLRIANGVVENIGKHFARLRENCLALNIAFPSINTKWIKDLVVKNQAFQGIWKLKIIITSGGFPFEALERKGALIMLLAPFHHKLEAHFRLTLYPGAVYSPLADIKRLGYLDRLWIKHFATKRGFNDALTLKEDGTVLETSVSNIFWRKGDFLFAPAATLPLLSGTMLQTVKLASSSLGINVQEADVQLQEIPSRGQVFVCNAMIGLQPVDQIASSHYKRDEAFQLSLEHAVKEVIRVDSLCCRGT